jgi:protein TonB
MGRVMFGFMGLAGCVTVSLAGGAPLPANAGTVLPDGNATPFSAAAPPQPVQLAAFDYDEFLERALELGMLSQTLRYTVTVAEDGKVTDCTLVRKFRRAFVNAQLCKAVVTSAKFAPARDGQGNAIAGTYKGDIKIHSFFQPDR